MTNAHIALHYSNLLHFSYIPTSKHKKLINNPLPTHKIKPWILVQISVIHNQPSMHLIINLQIIINLQNNTNPDFCYLV